MTGARKVTPELRAQMVEMLSAGTSVKKIARAAGLGAATVANNLKPELDERRALGKEWWCAEAVAKRNAILAAICEGEPYAAIARRFGITHDGAYKYRRFLTVEQQTELLAAKAAKRQARLDDRAAKRAARERVRRLKIEARHPRVTFRPHRDEAYAKLSAAMPKWLSEASRDDALSDLYVAYLEGRLPTDIDAEAKRYANRTVAAFESKFGPRSLDERLFDDSDLTIGDTLVDPAALEAFDYIFEEAQ